MARWVWLCAAILLAACGCGQAEPESLTARGEAAHRAGRYDEAIQLCTEAIAADANDSAAHLCRGQAYHFRNQPGDYERSVADYTDAIAINPRVPEPYYRRSLVYRDMGKNDLAAADDLRARSSDPTIQNSYKKLPDTTLPTGKLKPPKLDETTAQAEPAEEEEEPRLGTSGGVPGSLELEERRDYERLRQKFESRDPFGRVTNRRREPVAPMPSPFEAARPAETSSTTTETAPGVTSGVAGAKQGVGGAITGGNTTAGAISQPPPSSPFLPRPSYEPSAAMPVREGPRSPFPQVPSAPTGRFPQQTGNPFGAQPSQRQYYPTPFSRPINGPGSNPAVRNTP